MSENHILVATVCSLGKHGGQSVSRSGFMDEGKQIFLPPKAEKRVTAWKKKMSEKGYEF